MARNRYITGKQDPELSLKIALQCGLPTHSSLRKIIQMMYHVDTHPTFVGEQRDFGWRPQGYVYIKDLINRDINISSGEISTMDDEYILFFTLHLPLKEMPADSLPL